MTVKQKSNVLFGTAIVGLISTAALAIWADRKVQAKPKRKEGESWVKHNLEYAAPIAAMTITVTAMGANQYLSTQEMTRLAGVAGMAIANFSQYKGAVKEVAGEDIAEKVETAVKGPSEAQSGIRPISDALDENYGIKGIGSDDIITCRDELTGVEFETTILEVLEAEFDINKRVQHEEFVEVNDWLAYFGADNMPEFFGVGWQLDNLLTHGHCWIDFDHKLEFRGDQPINVISIKAPIDAFQREVRR